MAPFQNEHASTNGVNGGNAKQPEANGTYIDTIVDVSDDLHSMTDLRPLIKLLTMVYKVRSPNPGEECHLNTLMRTLSGDTLTTVRTENHPKGYSREEATQSFSRFLSPVLNGLTGLTEIEEAVGAGEDPAGFRQFWSLDNRNLLTDAISGSGSASSTDSDIDFLDTFVADKDRRIALTRDRGSLALVPNAVEAGDEVRGLSDSNQVRVLRTGKEGGGTASELRVIGEAYLHGYSADESCAPRSDADPGVPLEEIELA